MPRRFQGKTGGSSREKFCLEQFLEEPPIDSNAVIGTVRAVCRALAPHVADVSVVIDRAMRQGQVLFEGAQGTHLDIDHGTYPFVTSSNTVAEMPAAERASGRPHHGVVGIVKAYTTRVGAGPFHRSCSTRSATTCSPRAPNSAPPPAAGGAAAGSTWSLLNNAVRSQWPDRAGHHQTGCAGRVGGAQNLHGLSLSRAD
jgi:hypothetical protein